MTRRLLTGTSVRFAAASLLAMALVVLIAERIGRSTAPSPFFKEPGQFVGRSVTVEAVVHLRLTATAVLLSDVRGRDVKVAAVNVVPLPAIDSLFDDDKSVVGERIRISGVVRSVGIEQLEREIGAVDEDVFQPYLRQPVLFTEFFTPA